MDPNGLMQLLQMLHAGGFGSKTPAGQLPMPGGAIPGAVGAPSPMTPQAAPQGGGGPLGMGLGGLLPMLMQQQGGGGTGAMAGLGGLAGMLLGGH